MQPNVSSVVATLPSPHVVTLRERCRHAFTPAVRATAPAHVSALARWPAQVEATVADGDHGDRAYRVRARLDESGALELLCGCALAASLEPCVHLWSLLGALEGRRGVRAFEGKEPLDVTLRYGPTTRRIAALDVEAPPDSWERVCAECDDPVSEPDDRPPPSPDTLPSAPWSEVPATHLQVPSHRGPTSSPPVWRRPLDRLRDDLTVSPGRVGGLLPRTGSCVLELHVQREPFGSSQLRIMACWRRVLSDGSLGGFERGGANKRRQLTRAEHRQLERLGGKSIAYANTWTTSVTVPREAAATVLAELCAPSSAIARVGWVDAADEDGRGRAELNPLRWDGERPFEAELVVTKASDEGALFVTCRLRRDEERLRRDALVQLADGIAVARDRILRTDEGTTAWLRSIDEGLTIAPDDVDDFFAQLAETPDLPRLELDAAIGVTVVAQPPRPRLSVDRTGGPLDDQLPVSIEVGYGKETVPLELATSASWDGKRRILSRRDLAAEAALLARLGELGFRATEHPGHLTITAGGFEGATATLLDEGWDLRAKRKPIRHGRSLSLSLTSNQDWFELAGDVRFDQARAALPDLLKAARRKERWITLDDGSRGVVPAQWLEELSRFGEGERDGDLVRYSPAQASLIDVEGCGLAITADDGLARLHSELQTVDRLEPATPPSSFAGELRRYQAEGLGWLGFLRRFRFGGCLADDMGLGKTIQVLALLESRRVAEADGRARCSLVVAPRSLLFNWAAEAERFAPALRVGTYHGSSRRKLDFDDHDVVLTTYGTLRQDRERLKAQRFDYVILDEAQAIKNPRSMAAKACRALRCEHRLALSGTPIENHLGDLASLFEFLNPGISRSVEALRVLGKTLSPDEAQRRELAVALRPFILRRTKEEVLDDLPAKTEQILHCELRTRERREYDQLAEHYRVHLTEKIERDGFARSRFNVLEALLRLRQAACHPGLLNEARRDEDSAKLDMLLKHLAELTEAGHKALVFSQFTTLLGIVAARLDDRELGYAYLDGKTRDRAAPVQRFQSDPSCSVFLLSLKAGNAGLNLTAADYVFLLDPWWNPATEAQAVDRAHRIGQTRPVMAYRLVSKDTVEDRVVALSGAKRELARDVLGGGGGLSGFDARDLEILLR